MIRHILQTVNCDTFLQWLRDKNNAEFPISVIVLKILYSKYFSHTRNRYSCVKIFLIEYTEKCFVTIWKLKVVYCTISIHVKVKILKVKLFKKNHVSILIYWVKFIDKLYCQSLMERINLVADFYDVTLLSR